MLVTRYRNPAISLFEEFVNNFEKSQPQQEVFDFVPAVNTREGDDAYYVDVDLPGVKKEDVEISVDENVLTIKGKRETKEEVNEENYYRIESRYGTFSRSFTLPEKVDVENIKASSEDGVLEIVIPKQTVLKDSVKKIEIQ